MKFFLIVVVFERLMIYLNYMFRLMYRSCLNLDFIDIKGIECVVEYMY